MKDDEGIDLGYRHLITGLIGLLVGVAVWLVGNWWLISMGVP